MLEKMLEELREVEAECRARIEAAEIKKQEAVKQAQLDGKSLYCKIIEEAQNKGEISVQSAREQMKQQLILEENRLEKEKEEIRRYAAPYLESCCKEIKERLWNYGD